MVKAFHPESLLRAALSGLSFNSLFDGQLTRSSGGSGLRPCRLRDSLLSLVLIRLSLTLFSAECSVVVLHDAFDWCLRPVRIILHGRWFVGLLIEREAVNVVRMGLVVVLLRILTLS